VSGSVVSAAVCKLKAREHYIVLTIGAEKKDETSSFSLDIKSAVRTAVSIVC